MINPTVKKGVSILEEAEIISVLIKRTSLEFDKIANSVLAPYQLTNTQFKMLRYLAKQTDLTVTQRDLEYNFSMSNPAVTGILQNLEKKSLIIRKTNPLDARSKVIGLTEKSLALSSKLAQLSHEMDSRFTKTLSETEKEQLAILLQKILETPK